MAGTKKAQVKCFCCGRDLEAEKPDEDDAPMYWAHDAVTFRAAGNYGSRVYDPMWNLRDTGSHEELRVYICDQCVIKNIDRVTQVKVTKSRSTEATNKIVLVTNLKGDMQGIADVGYKEKYDEN